LQQTIEAFAEQYKVKPCGLSVNQRRELIYKLDELGLFNLRNAVPITVDLLGITRATIYNILKAK